LDRGYCTQKAIGEDGVQSTLFCIFDHCYFVSSPNKLKICHTVKQLYIHNIMPKHENNALQKKFYHQFKKSTFSVECAPYMWQAAANKWQAAAKKYGKRSLKHLGPKIWDCIDPSMYELSSFTFSNVMETT